jgi:hypothetical protein
MKKCQLRKLVHVICSKSRCFILFILASAVVLSAGSVLDASQNIPDIDAFQLNSKIIQPTKAPLINATGSISANFNELNILAGSALFYQIKVA